VTELVINDNSLTVSDLTELIKSVIKINFDKNISVIGEVSNFKESRGHAFFTLKDEDAMINAVIWNYSNKIENKINNGKKVKAYGNIVVFSKAGTYNFNIIKIELIGDGGFNQEYTKLKEYYNSNGYFDESKKKKLPSNLKNIGIITSYDGAALQDFLYVIKKNNYAGKVYIKNCIVQGKDCPTSVVSSLNELDKMNLDVIIITRGGGSFEDLFGFSNKNVIEEIYKCNTCIISAIGHEVDFMLSDFVADIRAPTPSIAGELVSCKQDGIYNINEILEIENNIKKIISTKITILEYDINTITNTIKSPNEIINKILNDINITHVTLVNMIKSKINDLYNNINMLTKSLNNVTDPNVIISNGFCLAFDSNDNRITNIDEFNASMSKRKKLKLKFINGEVTFDIRNIK
jgi:exodeoxyribonuclease VII large subunit